MDIQTYLTNMCEHSGIDATELEVTVDDQDEVIQATIKVPQEESGLLIGFHGDTLSAMQRLTRVVFQAEIGEKRFVLNVNEYLEQRTDRLRQMAFKAGQQVLDTGRPYRFNYLPAHERFVIHSALGENPEFSELQSASEGEGRDRVLVIRPKQAGSDNETLPE